MTALNVIVSAIWEKTERAERQGGWVPTWSMTGGKPVLVLDLVLPCWERWCWVKERKEEDQEGRGNFYILDLAGGKRNVKSK